ncbi:speedy protein E4-like [Myotis daubentonii]|uniref:speedy protein E4-like n=1 Tax=Myotis daubentonii TaxID=98922 RepID=UPI002873C9D2|nr:speedy protein E4-like [Myotis daubentonii]
MRSKERSALGGGVLPAAPASGRKGRRERSTEEEEAAPGTRGTWVVVRLRGLRMKLKRQRVSPELPQHHEAFTRLLEDPVIQRFLAWDSDLRVSDKYLLAMVVAYLGRAGLFSWQYQRVHFFLALYLASDMEEDNHAPKQAILSFIYGRRCSGRPLFHKLLFQFFRSMGRRARVTREEYEQIQAFHPQLWVWGRDRPSLRSLSPGGTPVFSRESMQTLMTDTRKGRRTSGADCLAEPRMF